MTDQYTESGESVGVTCIRCEGRRVELIDVNDGGRLYECRDCWRTFIV